MNEGQEKRRVFVVLIKTGICLAYFIIGGLATTNIMRLFKGCTVHVYSSQCSCPHCGMKISPLNQTPILSYIFSKGKCKQCGSPIPADALALEILIFIGMSGISIIGNFSLVSIFFSFIYYELVRIGCLIKHGRRENDFAKQYFLAVFAMFGYLLLIEFLGVLLLCV